MAIELHSKIGPGLLESVYEHTLAYELRKFGFFVEQQVPIPLIYKEVRLDCGYRLDLRIEKKVIIEIKAVDYMLGLHYALVLTYLKLCNCKLGLLMNFITVKLKEGIHRMVNGL